MSFSLAKCRAPGTDSVLKIRHVDDSAKWTEDGSREEVKLASGMIQTQRFKKGIIKVGTYVKASDGLAFKVTPETLNHWVLQFSRMKANGVKVPIPAQHQDEAWEKKARENGLDPRDNMGWVDNLWVEGDMLFMGCTLYGTDAIVAASRNDVSVFVPPKFIDGHGNKYAQPITHVAMVPDPVVPGLPAFIPLAASMQLEKKEPKTMDILEYMQSLAELLGLDPAQIADEEVGQALIAQAIDSLKGGGGAPAAAGDAQPAAGAAQPAAAGGGSEPAIRKETITRQFSKGDDDGDTLVHPMLITTTIENRGLKLSRLIDEGKITPAQAEKLAAEWCDKDTVAASLKAGDNGESFDKLLDVLGMGPKVATGKEKSGAQAVALSHPGREKPKKSSLVADAERRAEAARK